MIDDKNNDAIAVAPGIRISLCTALILGQAALPIYAWAEPNIYPQDISIPGPVTAGRGERTELPVGTIVISTGEGTYGLNADSSLPGNGLEGPAKILTDNAIIETDGAWGYGAVAINDAQVDLNGGSVTTSGERAYGLLAGADSLITSNTEINTKGESAAGVQAGVSKDAPGGTVELTDGSNITTTGKGAYGLHALFDGDIHGTTVIATSKENAFGAFAESDSVINLQNSDISTTGKNASGVLANNDEGGVAGKITLQDSTVHTAGSSAYGAKADTGGHIDLTDVDIHTKGQYGFGAFADSGATIAIKGGSILTSGDRAYGLLSGAGSTITSNTVINTEGASAAGVQAGVGRNDPPGGTVELTKGSSITTKGDGAYGLHALFGGDIHGTTDVETSGANAFGAFAESNSVINLQNSNIVTHGDGAAGVLANNDELNNVELKSVVFREAEPAVAGKIILTDSAVHTSGNDAAGASADTGGNIQLTNVNITTDGLRSYGASAASGATIAINGGSILTANDTGRGVQNGDGSRAYALYAQDADSTITANNLQIHTLGQRAYGAYALDGADITLSNSSVLTEGFMGYGLYASGDGSTLTANNVNVTTTGNVGDAVWAYNKATVNLNGGLLQVQAGPNSKPAPAGGETANGMTAVGDGVINARNVTVITKGKDSAGVMAGGSVGSDDTAGTINLINSSVQVQGANAVAARVSTGGVLSLQNSKLVADNGAGISLYDNATVTINNSAIVASKQTITSTLTSDAARQNITIGAGSSMTSNNGTLLQVNREEGAAGIVNLALGAGSVTSGDIIDTDARNGGGTDVTLQRGAVWSGLLSGVRNFISQQASRIVFRDKADIQGDLSGTGSTYTFSPAGGNIAGNVILNSGSSTHGGTIDTPVNVAGNVSVDETSVFGGNWNIQGNVDSQGTITPGNSIGVVNIGGDLNLAPGSVYVAEIDSSGNADRINVAGTANLDGVVEATPYNGMRLATSYTILTAADGLAGTRFDNVVMNDDYAFIAPTLTYGTNDVQLTVDRNDVAYASVGQTRNQRAVAGALDTLPVTGALGGILALSTVDTARAAFDQLSGDIHASLKNALTEDSRPLRDAISDRNAVAAERGSVWMKGYGASAGINGSEGVADLHHSTGGVLLGADMRIADSGYLGLLTGYGNSHFDSGSRNESGSSRNYHLGLYGGSAWGNLTFQAGIINSWNDVETDRYVGFNGLAEHLRGDYDARTLQVFGELGYLIQTGPVSLEPFASLAHVRLRTDAFSETGGISALSANKQDMDTTWSTLGVKAGSTFTLGNVDLNVTGKAGWQHAMDDTTPYSTLSFSDGSRFRVEGTHIAKDAAVLEAGLGTNLTQSVSVGIGWAGQFSDDSHNNGVNATLQMKF